MKPIKVAGSVIKPAFIEGPAIDGKVRHGRQEETVIDLFVRKHSHQTKSVNSSGVKVTLTAIKDEHVGQGNVAGAGQRDGIPGLILNRAAATGCC